MSQGDRVERHLMRQRGAGIRTIASSFGFSLTSARLPPAASSNLSPHQRKAFNHDKPLPAAPQVSPDISFDSQPSEKQSQPQAKKSLKGRKRHVFEDDHGIHPTFKKQRKDSFAPELKPKKPRALCKEPEAKQRSVTRSKALKGNKKHGSTDPKSEAGQRTWRAATAQSDEDELCLSSAVSRPRTKLRAVSMDRDKPLEGTTVEAAPFRTKRLQRSRSMNARTRRIGIADALVTENTRGESVCNADTTVQASDVALLTADESMGVFKPSTLVLEKEEKVGRFIEKHENQRYKDDGTSKPSIPTECLDKRKEQPPSDKMSASPQGTRSKRRRRCKETEPDCSVASPADQTRRVDITEEDVLGSNSRDGGLRNEAQELLIPTAPIGYSNATKSATHDPSDELSVDPVKHIKKRVGRPPKQQSTAIPQHLNLSSNLREKDFTRIANMKYETRLPLTKVDPNEVKQSLSPERRQKAPTLEKSMALGEVSEVCSVPQKQCRAAATKSRKPESNDTKFSAAKSQLALHGNSEYVAMEKHASRQPLRGKSVKKGVKREAGEAGIASEANPSRVSTTHEGAASTEAGSARRKKTNPRSLPTPEPSSQDGRCQIQDADDVAWLFAPTGNKVAPSYEARQAKVSRQAGTRRKENMLGMPDMDLDDLLSNIAVFAGGGCK